MKPALWLPGLVLAVVAASPQAAPEAGETARTENPGNAAGAPGGHALERLRFNPRERTERGIERLEEGDLEAARDRFATAGRLAEEDPLARFNAGTAELLAGTDQGLEDLRFAAETASPELAPAAHYNVGNAHLLAGRPAEAIEAYKQSLRLAPENQDAKYNLELARRMQQQQQQQQEQQGQQQQEEEEEEGEQEPQPSDGEQEEEGEEPKPRQGEEQEEEQESGQEPSEDEPLPDFQEQPDMTAEQAAAILEAVENLERDERRRQAEERARKKGRKGKDW